MQQRPGGRGISEGPDQTIGMAPSPAAMPMSTTALAAATPIAASMSVPPGIVMEQLYDLDPTLDDMPWLTAQLHRIQRMRLSDPIPSLGSRDFMEDALSYAYT